jgi:hypothetical protein
MPVYSFPFQHEVSEITPQSLIKSHFDKLASARGNAK